MPRLTGLPKDERQLVEHIFKTEGNNAPMILRQFEKNAKRMNTKGKMRCHSCDVFEDHTFPKTLWMCRRCAKFLVESRRIRRESILKVEYHPSGECEWCMERDHRFAKTHFRICEKCLRKFVRRDKYRESAVHGT